MLQIPQEAFKTGLLSKSFHDRLIADLQRLAQQAGIPAKFVWAPLSINCPEAVVEWVRGMQISQDSGFAYIGKSDPPVETQMMAITGALMRNYVDARMMSVQDVLSRLRKETMPSPSVLLVPNFCLDKADGGDIPTWQVSSLMGLLLDRMAQEKKTILSVGSMTALEKTYGSAFREHIESHYATFQN
jgi:hypothetical protein